MKKTENHSKAIIVIITMISLLMITLSSWRKDLERHHTIIETKTERIEADSLLINQLYNRIDSCIERLEFQHSIVEFLNDEVARLHGRNYLSYFRYE